MSRPPKVARVASAILSQLLMGPRYRRALLASVGESRSTLTRAVGMLRTCGVCIDNEGRGGCIYRLRHPEKVRALIDSALRLSLGDLIEAGGIAPAAGLGILIESGALHTEAA